MTIADGAVHALSAVYVSGLATDRWNLVLVSDGYQLAQLPTFATDAQDFADRLLAIDPFFALAGEINIFRIDVSSHDFGADDPATGTTARTYFDATFSSDPHLARLLYVDDHTVHDVVQNLIPAADATLVLVNTPTYGGSGGNGSPAVMSRAVDAHLIGFHELGHSAFGLADEYEYQAGCKLHEMRGPYTGPEPGNGNVTRQTVAAQIPWHKQLGVLLPALPTTTNLNCTDCDVQTYPHLDHVVGAFDGANTWHCGVYRPQLNCRMRDQRVRFCAVCSSKITAGIMGVPWP
jgi:hypothetical protein